MEKALRDKLPGGKFENVPPAHSNRMRAIKARDARSTERRFRMALVRAGIKGWTMRPQGIAGKPDLFFPGSRVAVFLDGCFWHGCPVHGHVPDVNRSYWEAKIRRNKGRDCEAGIKLGSWGIQVLRLWEHAVESELAACVEQVRKVAAV